MPQTTDGKKYRVRYASVPKRNASEIDWYNLLRKNVLVTIEQGSGKDRFVFFGIARCKLSADNFSKKEGRELALSRALKFLDICDSLGDDSLTGLASFYLDDEGARGYCKVRYVKTLLRHFEGLDQK